MTSELRDIFESLSRHEDLTRAQARSVFARIMAGQWSEAAIGAVVGAILVKGESVDELVGAAEAMRDSAVKIACPKDAIDTCGTGGDRVSTFNVSTTAALIAAAAGATVAKHGNRSTSRVSGSTEVLTELGIDVEAETNVVERCLREIGVGYLNARRLHPAMKYASPIRQALPVRTIFNLLGPLTNPAGVKRQLVGVPRRDLVDKMSQALLQLGTLHAWVVQSDDGLCDVTITGPSTVAEVRDGSIVRFRISPQNVGLPPSPLDALRVSSVKESADAIHAILAGQPGPRRDHALLNAGAALVVAGVAHDLRDGVTQAAHAVDNGAAADKLIQWRILAGVDPS